MAVFITTPEFLLQQREQLEMTHDIIERARQRGQLRIVENEHPHRRQPHRHHHQPRTTHHPTHPGWPVMRSDSTAHLVRAAQDRSRRAGAALTELRSPGELVTVARLASTARLAHPGSTPNPTSSTESTRLTTRLRDLLRHADQGLPPRQAEVEAEWRPVRSTITNPAAS
ncbi:hypothetical protein [Rhodococcus daqingensis]|uniref:Uncharacterized protein n=1 Tax=Rhodococcus daqingensis TaxID=2479363 RepID=A0ABW2RYY9_9NOCA